MWIKITSCKRYIKYKIILWRIDLIRINKLNGLKDLKYVKKLKGRKDLKCTKTLTQLERFIIC